MKFIVARTSLYSSDVQPCEEAVHDTGKDDWFIEIENLEQLLAFQARYGELIIDRISSSGQPFIEIYDDHRE